MIRKSISILALLVVLGFLGGCANDVTTPPSADGGDLSPAVMADIAMDSDLITEQVLSAELDSMSTLSGATTGETGGSGTVVQDVTFSRMRACPGGGQFRVQGTIHRTFNRDTAVMEAESSGTRTRTDCTFARGDTTITVNGEAEWETFRRRVDGRPDGLQTSHYSGGSTAVRGDGQERSCRFDITVVRNPETRTRTLDGIICGTEVHRSVTWSFVPQTD